VLLARTHLEAMCAAPGTSQLTTPTIQRLTWSKGCLRYTTGIGLASRHTRMAEVGASEQRAARRPALVSHWVLVRLCFVLSACAIDDGSEYRRRIENMADHFVDVVSMSFREASEIIAEHNCHILLDMQVHTRRRFHVPCVLCARTCLMGWLVRLCGAVGPRNRITRTHSCRQTCAHTGAMQMRCPAQRAVKLHSVDCVR